MVRPTHPAPYGARLPYPFFLRAGQFARMISAAKLALRRTSRSWSAWAAFCSAVSDDGEAISPVHERRLREPRGCYLPEERTERPDRGSSLTARG